MHASSDQGGKIGASRLDIAEPERRSGSSFGCLGEVGFRDLGEASQRCPGFDDSSGRHGLECGGVVEDPKQQGIRGCTDVGRQLGHEISYRFTSHGPDRHGRSEHDGSVGRLELVDQRRLELGKRPRPVACPDRDLRSVAEQGGRRAPLAESPRECEPWLDSLERGSWVAVRFDGGPVDERAEQGPVEPVRLGERLAAADQREPLGNPTESTKRRALRQEGVRDDRDEVCVLGGFEDRVGHLDRASMLLGQHQGARKLAAKNDGRGIGGKVGELRASRLQDGQGIWRAVGNQERAAQGSGRARDRRPITGLPLGLDGRPEMAIGDGVTAGRRGGVAGPFEEFRAVARIAGDAEGLLEECEGLLVGAEQGSALGRCPEGDPGLGAERLRLRSVGCVVPSGEIVAGQRGRDLVGLERFEIAGRGQVAGLAVALRQGVVGDLADQRLDERVLAPARAPRVRLVGKQLSPDEHAEASLEGALVDAGNRPRARPG